MAKRRSVRNTGGTATAELNPRYHKAAQEALKSPVGAPVWKPTKEGEVVAGKIISQSWRDGKDKPYLSLILDTGSSAIMVRPTTQLYQLLADHKVAMGAELAIAFRGTAPSSYGPGRPAKLFSLHVVKEGNGDPLVTTEHLASMETKRERKQRTKRKVARRGRG